MNQPDQRSDKQPVATRLEAIILAAGDGARMRSTLPKTLHAVGGRPMLAHIIEAVNSLMPATIHIVVGRQGEQVKSAIAEVFAQSRHAEHADGDALRRINWVTQSEPLGSGHAALQALPAVDPTATVLLLYGDTPLLGAQTLRSLAASGGASDLGLLTATVDDPTGLGRIVRDRRGAIVRIVEERDADEAHRQIRECNAGCLAAPAAVLADALAKLDNDNAQGEFYLTDVVAHAIAAGVEVVSCQPGAVAETFGVNSRADLARVERLFQAGQARRLLEEGVTLRDPARLDVRGRCEFGRDCVVDVNVILEGRVVIGDDCALGANVIIRNSRIGDGCVIEANSVIDNAVVGARCRIGPFARLRPQSQLEDGVHIGNFVEIKKSRLGSGVKANHLSYVGDSALGRGVNIGAGVITCNYDGRDKHRTVIGDDVFVGANSELVAPLAIGDGATIGAGSTITEDVAAEALAVGRAKQKTVRGWTRPAKKSAGERA